MLGHGTFVGVNRIGMKKMDRHIRKAAMRALAGRRKPSKILRRYFNDIARFTKTHPDFYSAYKHLMQSRVDELAAYFFGDRPIGLIRLATIRDMIENEERTLVEATFARKESPAEAIYLLAERRGWKPPAPPKRRRKHR